MTRQATQADWALAIADSDGGTTRLPMDAYPAIFGSAEQATVHLPGPALLAEIRRSPDGSFGLDVHDDSVAVSVNGHPQAAGSQKLLLSGDEIQLGNVTCILEVQFPACAQRPSLRIMSGLALAILTATVLSEVFLIGWLPARLSQQEVWGVDIARHKTLALADTLRKRSSSVPGEPEAEASARSLLAHALDDMTVQLREHGYAMEAHQLTACYDVLLQIEKRLNGLDDQTLLPPPKKLNAAPFLERILPPPNEED